MTTLRKLGAESASFYGEGMAPIPLCREIQLSNADLPEVAAWEVGKTYRLVVEVEQVAVRKEQPRTDGSSIFNDLVATFRMKAVGVEDGYEDEYAARRGS